MTTASALSKFDILLDKYGSPYFEESEKLEFLNMAQNEVLNRLVPDSLGGVVNFEMDANVAAVLQPLIGRVFVTPTASEVTSSIVSYNTINAALTTAFLESTTVFRLISVSIGDSPIKYSRINNLSASRSNFFKKQEYLYTLLNGGIRIYPSYTLAITVHAIKTPRIMTAGNSPDWDDYVMNQVILHAVKLAGVPLRDEEIQQDIRLSGFQSAQ